ncbi:MAG: vitamin K epoxide reductase family protein [Niabella sp.]
MKLSNLLAQPMQHCEDAAAHLLSALNIQYTWSYLQRELTEHPDYPSLASIADVIGISYDVACAPIRIPVQEFRRSADFRLPFLALIKPKGLHHEIFAVVTKCTEDAIELYNPATKKQEIYTIASFDEIYNGLTLVVEAGSKTQEEDYKSNLKQEKQAYFFNAIVLLALPVITIIVSITYLFNYPVIDAIVPVIFTGLALAGSLIATLLLWHEIDEYNPVIRQVCQATAKVNCSAVLHSKGSKIWGISWSNLGFTYFGGMLLSLLVTGISQNALVLSAWMSIPALCYPVYSIYYQWKVVKQWCVLCLAVQGILLLLFITALAGSFYKWPLSDALSVHSITGFGASFLFVFVAVTALMPALQKAKSSRQKTIELQRMKHNPQLFEGLLAKQKSITKPDADLGITIGRPDSVYRLVKVCNPYCGPCAKAHPVIEDLVNNNDEVSLQIIFTASDDEKDIKRAPVMHLMAIDSKGDKALTQQALDDWYLSPTKDYNTFAAKYPVNGAFEQQGAKVNQMREWCDNVKINFTPAFFLCTNNNEDDAAFYQLPEMYTIADLKYFFTV